LKTIGLIGGLSWEASIEYYRLINESVRGKLGGTHSAKILMYSFDFEEVKKLQHSGDWETLTNCMVQSAAALTDAGADFIVICSNTMHKMAGEIEDQVGTPLLHIADATAEPILSAGLKRVGLLGTQFTMEQDFYKGRLVEKFGLEVLIPSDDDREIIHQIIYSELVFGRILDRSRQQYIEIIDRMVRNGAQGIILGCTEIGLLVNQSHVDIPLFDTTYLHAIAAVDRALETKSL